MRNPGNQEGDEAKWYWSMKRSPSGLSEQRSRAIGGSGRGSKGWFTKKALIFAKSNARTQAGHRSLMLFLHSWLSHFDPSKFSGVRHVNPVLNRPDAPYSSRWLPNKPHKIGWLGR